MGREPIFVRVARWLSDPPEMSRIALVLVYLIGSIGTRLILDSLA